MKPIPEIRKAIYKWGVYPALVMLRELHDNEEYEQCAVLKSVLDEIIDGREWYLTTKVDDHSLRMSYVSILDGFTKPELIEQNMPVYIRKFMEEVI
jgi:hypothetical protein